MDTSDSNTIPVLHVINGELYSGAERVQDLLALGLPLLGYSVGFACLKPDKFPGRRMAKSAPLHLLRMSSRWDLGCGIKLARIVREQGYRVLHTHTPRTAMVGRVASALTGVPMVHHVHSPTSRDTESLLRNRINSVIERVSLTGARRLIPVSHSLECHLLGEGFPPERIRVVANGVPTHGPLPNRKAPDHHWVIGSVALFRPRKGIEVLIEALALLRKQGRSVRLRAVGPFETRDYQVRIMALAERLNVLSAIDWTGFTGDVNTELARMDVFVLPSLFGEGLPMVLLEAMAMGVPVVASHVEGIPEVIDHAHSGLLVQPSDVQALTAALGDLMDERHDWRAMREAAYDTQRAHFSDSSMAIGVAKVYREVLGHG